MTQEEKAKTYDEALKRAKAAIDIAADKDLVGGVVRTIFPELRESEDERIRKFLVDYFTSYKIGNVATKLNGVRIDDILAYLEKQKEEKPVVTHGETYHVDTLGTQQMIAGKMPQKPVQSEEEKEYVRTLKGLVSDFIRNSGGGITDVSYYQRIYDWLDGRHIEQKPAEWSEEDEEMINSCISSIEESKENRYAYKENDGDTSYDREITWLKSLRPSWKPSENQMSMLLAVVNDPNNAGSASCHISLKSLYNDLKKL